MSEFLTVMGEKICENQRPFGLAEVRAYLIDKQPGFAGLLFGLTRTVFVEGNVVETAATDGKDIFLSMEFWEGNTVEENAFLLAHEILHIIGQHPARMQRLRQAGFDGKPFDPRLYNDAADYVGNDILIEARCGTLPGEGLYDPAVGTRNDTIDHVYRRLKQEQDKNPGQGQGQGAQDPDKKQIPGSGSFDALMPPVEDAPSEAQIEREVASAVAIAKSRGQEPAGLMRLFGEILNPKVDWKRLLRQAFHASRGRSRSTWRRLNRRFMPQGLVMPGRDGVALGTVVVGIDTSGSIGVAETKAYLGEVASILEETRPKELWAVPCDARVYTPARLKTPDELRDFARKGLRGGGGTRFEPVFQWVEENNINPEVMMFFTDTYGSFPPKAPSYPVIWVTTGSNRIPFGKIIPLEL